MDDAQLNKLLRQASYGEVQAAKAAMLEIADRLIKCKPLTSEAVVSLVSRLILTIEADDAARFLFPKLPKRGRGRPKKTVGRISQLVEALTLAQARGDGFKDESIDRATAAGRHSSFQDAARRLGYEGAEIDRVAERLSKDKQKAGKAAGKKSTIVPRV